VLKVDVGTWPTKSQCPTDNELAAPLENSLKHSLVCHTMCRMKQLVHPACHSIFVSLLFKCL